MIDRTALADELEDRIARQVYEATPHKVISQAAADVTGLPMGATIPYDTFLAVGGKDEYPRKIIGIVLAALRAEPAKPVDREKVAKALYCVEGRAATWDKQEGAQWAHYMDEHREHWLKLADAAIAVMGGK